MKRGGYQTRRKRTFAHLLGIRVSYDLTTVTFIMFTTPSHFWLRKTNERHRIIKNRIWGWGGLLECGE